MKFNTDYFIYKGHRTIEERGSQLGKYYNKFSFFLLSLIIFCDIFL